MPQRNLLILLIATGISSALYAIGEQNPYARYAARGLAEIEAGALEHVPNEELFDAAMEAMVDLLHQQGDEHSQFITRQDADPFRAEMRQQFGGIGVRIRFTGEPPQLVVVGSPDPGTPAARADIRAGDRILKIDDGPTDGMTMAEVLQAMRGEPGEPIRLSIQHADADMTETLTLIREVITVDSILGDRRNADGSWEFRLENDPRIALVRVTIFANRTVQELERTLTELTAAGVEAVVLDLRDDSGGALDVAVAICDMLLPAGLPIVEIRGRGGRLHERYETSGDGQFMNLPLAVLVNNQSASASEIVAACLQDHRRTVIVGQRSFGKGTVQKLIPTEAGQSLLKLTSASYWRPSGRNIHRSSDAQQSDDWGVSPDLGFDVPYTDEQYEAFRKDRNDRDLIVASPPDDAQPVDDAAVDADAKFVDGQLEKAVEYLQSELAGQQAG
jgi:carboxyl-terminal processing protease